MFVEGAIVGAEVGLNLFEERKRLLQPIRKLRYLIRHGRLIILTFGAGGTGKTTFGRIISGEADYQAPAGPYEESVSIEDYKIGKDIVCSMTVAPGQLERVVSMWPELFLQLPRGRAGAVINVVSYGYHSFAELSFKDTKYYTPGMTRAKFMASYLETRREEEVKLLTELLPRLKDAKKEIWMLTLVTKQDLWWHERNKVREYYQTGAYNRLIEEVAHARGKRNFRHEYSSASLVMSNFSSAGDMLASTVAGYDQNIQFRNLHRVVETVNKFAAYRALS